MGIYLSIILLYTAQQTQPQYQIHLLPIVLYNGSFLNKKLASQKFNFIKMTSTRDIISTKLAAFGFIFLVLGRKSCQLKHIRYDFR